MGSMGKVLVYDHPDHASRSSAQGVTYPLNLNAYRLTGVFEALRVRADYCI